LTEDSYTKVSIEEIGTNSSNQRVDNFLLGKFKDLPKSKIYSIIRKGEVRINGSRVKPHFKLSLGDKIRIPPLFLSKKSVSCNSSFWGNSSNLNDGVSRDSKFDGTTEGSMDRPLRKKNPIVVNEIIKIAYFMILFLEF